MPPTRTIPPAKAMKTERTHEENQERAYIAASRRSDRSLEARVESARRASEIHKRRTGRSLRVTEQDVINEEMYEEEDDDLPLAYRRLTAHLQTNSVDFNQRLQAYITNQVAMRSALERSYAINQMNGYSGSNVPNLGSSSISSMFPSPMLAHHPQQNMQSPSSPASYRSAPYPSPRPPQHDFSDSQQRRPASIAIPSEVHGSAQDKPLSTSQPNRRLSLPVKVSASESPPKQSGTPISASAALPEQQMPRTDGPSTSESKVNQQMPSYDFSTFNSQMYPFSLSLPAESQMMLAPAMTQNDPLVANMMAGMNNQSFDFNQPWLSQDHIGKDGLPSNYQGGLNKTLAPSNIAHSPLDWTFGQENQPQDFFQEVTRATGATPAVTPGINGESWNNFIEADEWDASPSSGEAQ